MDAARHPYVVGVAWFQYRDEPVSGRGPGHGTGPRLRGGFRVRSCRRRRPSEVGPSRGDARSQPRGRAAAPEFPGAGAQHGRRGQYRQLRAGRAGRARQPDLDLWSRSGRRWRRGASQPSVAAKAGRRVLQARRHRRSAGACRRRHTRSTQWCRGSSKGRQRRSSRSPPTGSAGNSIAVQLAPYAPGIFTADSSGTGQGAVLINGTALLACSAGFALAGTARETRRVAEHLLQRDSAR